jgi:hypothetical protein
VSQRPPVHAVDARRLRQRIPSSKASRTSPRTFRPVQGQGRRSSIACGGSLRARCADLAAQCERIYSHPAMGYVKSVHKHNKRERAGSQAIAS